MRTVEKNIRREREGEKRGERGGEKEGRGTERMEEKEGKQKRYQMYGIEERKEGKGAGSRVFAGQGNKKNSDEDGGI